jgi:hypothetical protein
MLNDSDNCVFDVEVTMLKLYTRLKLNRLRSSCSDTKSQKFRIFTSIVCWNVMKRTVDWKLGVTTLQLVFDQKVRQRQEVNPIVNKQVPALHTANIRLSSESDRF